MKTKRKNGIEQYAVTTGLILIYIMSFVFSYDIKNGISNSLSMCAKVIIPSIFPVMVISNTLLLYGIPTGIKRISAAPFRLLFGLSSNGAVCSMFGLTGGYPVGVKTAGLMYERSIISKEEAQRIATVCVSPGLSFSISVAGTFFSSLKAGIVIFFCCLLGNITLGIILRIFHGRIKAHDGTEQENVDIFKAFLLAVDKSTSSVISVCAFILVFSAVSSLCGTVLPAKIADAILLFSEVTAGTQYAAENGKFIIAVFLCGFGGLSVFTQLLPDIKALGLNTVIFLSARIATGIFAVAFELIIVNVFNVSVAASKSVTSVLYQNSFSGALFLFGASLLLIISLLENDKQTYKGKRI